MDPAIGNILLILCFVTGAGLIILEAFIPGFGAAGIFGLVLSVIGIGVTWSRFGSGYALLALLAVLLVIVLAVTLSYRSAMRGRLSKTPLILNEQEAAVPASSVSGAEWIGKTGVTVSALRPSGFIEIDGKKLSAASAGEFLEKGAKVLVTGKQGDCLLIRRANVSPKKA